MRWFFFFFFFMTKVLVSVERPQGRNPRWIWQRLATQKLAPDEKRALTTPFTPPPRQKGEFLVSLRGHLERQLFPAFPLQYSPPFVQSPPRDNSYLFSFDQWWMFTFTGLLPPISGGAVRGFRLEKTTGTKIPSRGEALTVFAYLYCRTDVIKTPDSKLSRFPTPLL